MTPLIVALAGGACVAAVIGAALMAFRNPTGSAMEDRLDVLAGKSKGISDLSKKEQSVLSRPLDDVPNAIEEFVANFLNVRRLLEQADMAMSPAKFVAISLGLGGIGLAIGLVTQFHWAGYIIFPLVLMPIPLLLASMKKKKRMKMFTKQLPEALELTARALRAGHSLGAGLQMVSAEIPEPLGLEFGRVYEEQNLGIALEDALNNLCERVPSLDLRFFATAVILQRTTGGDLAEILEKIGRLIRERFRIWGQIQALTGEGRLSGVVLLGLPPVLLIALLFLNYEYESLLITTTLGKKLLAVTAFMQLLGAYVIKKIVNIKV
jgi:tight adherence protein B